MAARRDCAVSRGARLGARVRPSARSALDGWIVVVLRAECALVLSIAYNAILCVLETSCESPSPRVRVLRVSPARQFSAALLLPQALPYPMLALTAPPKPPLNTQSPSLFP